MDRKSREVGKNQLWRVVRRRVASLSAGGRLKDGPPGDSWYHAATFLPKVEIQGRILGPSEIPKWTKIDMLSLDEHFCR